MSNRQAEEANARRKQAARSKQQAGSKQQARAPLWSLFLAGSETNVRHEQRPVRDLHFVGHFWHGSDVAKKAVFYNVFWPFWLQPRAYMVPQGHTLGARLSICLRPEMGQHGRNMA